MSSKTLLAVLVFLLFAGIVSAFGLDDRGNPNDPNTNPRANACYAEGAMAGKCDTDWEWNAGWYLIRYQYGLLGLGDIPEIYRGIVTLFIVTPALTSGPSPTPSLTPLP